MKDDLENIKILNQHGSDALKAIFLLNGGASIAFLTFLGSIALGKVPQVFEASDIAQILIFFSIGAGLSVSAYAFNYLNILSGIIGKETLSNFLLVVTILMAGSSIVIFFVGIWQAIETFTVFGT
ncbi:MAG: hypothetical protein ABJN40_22795 [Sneathiella sp.]